VTRRRGGLVATVVLTAGLLAGCTSARSSPGTSDSSCFLSLPTASQAVHGHGHFLGVHRFSVSALRKKAPRLTALMAKDHPGTQDICITAYTGTFTAATVSKPLGKPAGKLAVVITETGTNHLVATVIFTRLPLRFAHSHIL
jgi:hypothetical protein